MQAAVAVCLTAQSSEKRQEQSEIHHRAPVLVKLMESRNLKCVKA